MMDKEVLRLFQTLPAMYAGSEGVVRVRLQGAFRASGSDDVSCLGMKMGATVRAYADVTVDDNESFSMYVYAQNETAKELLTLPEESVVTAYGRLVFGIVEEAIWACDEMKYIVARTPVEGFEITIIRDVQTPS